MESTTKGYESVLNQVAVGNTYTHTYTQEKRGTIYRSLREERVSWRGGRLPTESGRDASDRHIWMTSRRHERQRPGSLCRRVYKEMFSVDDSSRSKPLSDASSPHITLHLGRKNDSANQAAPEHRWVSLAEKAEYLTSGP